MTPEAKLDALFAAARPPERDYAFQTEVARRVARRRAWGTVAALTPWIVAATVVLWALRPVVGPMADSLAEALEPVAMTLIGAATVAGVALWLSGRVSVA
jgi:hypothetical protein